jgi:hypothetical protein
MSARRYVVRRLNGYRKGDRRWVVWDTVHNGWADDAQTTRQAAQDICDELEAGAASATHTAQVNGRNVFVATAATAHFDFLAIGASRAEAIRALLDAWRDHTKQTGADPTYLTADDINVVNGPPGQAFRDGSPYPDRKRP